MTHVLETIGVKTLKLKFKKNVKNVKRASNFVKVE